MRQFLYYFISWKFKLKLKLSLYIEITRIILNRLKSSCIDSGICVNSSHLSVINLRKNLLLLRPSYAGNSLQESRSLSES